MLCRIRTWPALVALKRDSSEGVPPSKTLFWGLGWGIQREYNSVMLWHWGDNGAFKAFVMADPARKSGVVMFANGEDALNVAKPIIDTAMGTDSLAFAWLK